MRLDAAGAILKIGLFVCLLREKVILLGVVTQRLYVDPQYSRQNAALFICSQVTGVALFLITGYKDRNFCILTDFLTEPGKREDLSSDKLQFLYTRLVFGTEEDITKINMRSYDDEADMKSYKLLFKIRDENDYLFQVISNMVHLLSRSETSDK